MQRRCDDFSLSKAHPGCVPYTCPSSTHSSLSGHAPHRRHCAIIPVWLCFIQLSHILPMARSPSGSLRLHLITEFVCPQCQQASPQICITDEARMSELNLIIMLSGVYVCWVCLLLKHHNNRVQLTVILKTCIYSAVRRDDASHAGEDLFFSVNNGWWESLECEFMVTWFTFILHILWPADSDLICSVHH